jgi:curved DNA-binding protein CbpA
VDASALLNRGLNLLSNTPFETLDVAIGARTQEIRKAYKKMALKYHPDKNPLTTPLFQVIHAACEKLSDKEQRTKEESKVTARARQFGTSQQSTQLPPKPTNPTTYTKRNEGFSNGSNPPYPSRNDPRGDQHQSNEFKPSFPNAPRSTGGGQQQQYDEMLKEQNKKADSDRRAKEFAARHASEAEIARRREVELAQRAKYQEELKANRDEMLRKAQREYSNYCRQSFDHPVVGGSGSSKSNRSRQQSFESKSDHGPASAHGDNKVSEGVYLNKPPFQKPVVNQPQPAPIPQKPAVPLKVPVPFGLKCTSIGTTMVELEWQISQNHPQTLSVELSWKNRAMGLRVWESASTLISSGRCRKKNLVAGAVYEFR